MSPFRVIPKCACSHKSITSSEGRIALLMSLHTEGVDFLENWKGGWNHGGASFAGIYIPNSPLLRLGPSRRLRAMASSALQQSGTTDSLDIYLSTAVSQTRSGYVQVGVLQPEFGEVKSSSLSTSSVPGRLWYQSQASRCSSRFLHRRVVVLHACTLHDVRQRRADISIPESPRRTWPS